jgi:2-aminoadipate transaminase
MAGDLMARRGAEMLQYASAQGDPPLRERICDVMALEGIRATANDIVVTVGALGTFAAKRVIYLGSFSKTIAAGPRVGWALAPHGVRAKLVPAAESAMAPRAIAGRVAYVPGAGFYSDGSGHGRLRLSYCYPEPACARASAYWRR